MNGLKTTVTHQTTPKPNLSRWAKLANWQKRVTEANYAEDKQQQFDTDVIREAIESGFLKMEAIPGLAKAMPASVYQKRLSQMDTLWEQIKSEICPPVAVGQLWIDNNPFSRKRVLQIEKIENGYAHYLDVVGKRRSRIRLNRFELTDKGYRLASSEQVAGILAKVKGQAS